MTIPSHGLYSGCFLRLDPLVLLSVKYTKLAVIFLAIIATEHIQFFVVKSGGMIFYLRCAKNRLVLSLLMILSRKTLQLVLIRNDWLRYKSPREFCLAVQIALILFLVVAAILATDWTSSMLIFKQSHVVFTC